MQSPKAISTITSGDWLKTAQFQLLWLTLANVAITILTIATGLLVARHFSQDDYGQLSYFINVFGTLRLIAAFGMTGHITFEIASTRGREESVAARFYPLLAIRVATIIGVTVLTAGLGYIREDSLLMIAGLAAALALLSDFVMGALQGFGHVGHVVSVLVIQSALYGLGVVVTIIRELPVSAIYVAYTASFAPAILLAVIWLGRAIKPPNFNNLRLIGLWASVRYAGGMYLLAILSTTFTSYMTMYLGMLGRFQDAAVITIPLNLAFMPGVFVGAAMTMFYFPRFSALYAGKHAREAQELFTLFYSLVSAFTIMVAASLFVYPRVLLGFLYGNRYLDSAALLALIAPVACLYTVLTVLTFTIAAQGRIRASIPGIALSVVVLLGSISIASGVTGDLVWFAIAHSLAAAVGLIWQFRLVGYELRHSLVRTTKQVVVAAGLLCATRLAVADTPDQIPVAVVMLGVITVIYAIWVWFEIGARG